MSKRLDDLENSYLIIFKKYGDPNEHVEKYQELFHNIKINTLKNLYQARNLGELREYIVYYYSDIEIANDIGKTELIDIIDQQKMKKDGTSMIYIDNEINDLKMLETLKKRYPDDDILMDWNHKYAMLDDVISTRYMIDYLKSLVDENLSPLEKVTLVYDLVKSNYYKEEEKGSGSSLSRYITKMVNNTSIVCVGYVDLLSRTLKELGFKTFPEFLRTKSENEPEGHARILINIKDEKYGIDGYYFFDPTWDNAKDKRIIGNFSKNYTPTNQFADALSSYKFFLVSPLNYETVFGKSYAEKFDFTKKDGSTIRKPFPDICHKYQKENIVKPLTTYEFTKLLSVVKKEEGYSQEEIPGLIQESLYLSGYGKYKIDAIEEVVNEPKNIENNKK